MTRDRVVVTGGTGYVAGWAIVALLRQGYAVRTTVRSASRAQAVRDAVASEVPLEAVTERLELAVADLTSGPGWDDAMAGVEYVLHVASPLGGGRDDEESLVRPAVDGTLRVLRAATAAGVRRVVMTSSGAAATPAPKGDVVIAEDLWTDPGEPGLTAYRRSKVLAEKAAWDFVATTPLAPELTTVLPGAIFGPALPGTSRSSTAVLERLLTGAMPAVPHIEMGISDVRDLAELHLLAMTEPVAAGERYLGTSEVLTMGEIARLLRDGLGERAGRTPTRAMPDLVLRVVARFRPEVRALVPMLGRHITTSSAKAQEQLGWRPRPARETVVDTGRFLLDHPADGAAA